MQNLSVAEARKADAIGKQAKLQGWIRTRRDSKGGFSFLELNDGSCFGNIQISALGGLSAGFAFFVFSEVSRNFAMAGLTSAAAAAWVPVIIAASLALTVLLYREDG